jgi:hypothetical protein
MSVAVITGTSNLNPLEVDVAKVAVVELDPRTRHVLEAPIVPTLLRHAGRPELWQSPRVPDDPNPSQYISCRRRAGCC